MKYPLIYLLSFLMAIAVLPIANYLIDQYSIYHPFTIREGIEPNKHYLKTQYLKTHHEKYNCILLGSSRVGHIDVALFEDEDTKCINFTHSASIPNWHLEILKTLKNENASFKKIIVGVDRLAINKKINADRNDYLRRGYPDSFLEKIKFHHFYLYKKLNRRDIKIMQGEYSRVDEPCAIATESSCFYKMREISDKNYRNAKAVASRKPKHFPVRLKEENIPQVFSDLMGIKDIAENEFDAELVVFITPMHRYKIRNFTKKDVQLLNDFNLKLVDSGLSLCSFGAIERNDKYWYEEAHFTALLGDEVGEAITEFDPQYCSRDIDGMKVINKKLLDRFEKTYSKLMSVRHKDIEKLNLAIEQYYAKYGHYPVTMDFDGIYAPWIRPSKVWIQGLAPEFINKLPRDPRKNQHYLQQYLYKSDGDDYKLIAHGVDTSNVDSLLKDPVRKSSAFGFWTPGAKNW